MRLTSELADRARGALIGLAIGDATGMPTQSMSRADIATDYGVIDALRAAGPRQVIAAGRPAGAITDDTEQALLLAELLVAGQGHLDPMVFADALIAWEGRMAATGSLDLLGPSTKRALERLRAGVPAAEAGRYGATNGAAMRVAPVGVAHPPQPLTGLVDLVVEASMVTHNTSIGLAAAAAVAAAISVGVEGGSLEEGFEVAVTAANQAAAHGHWVPGGEMGPRIAMAVAHLPTVPKARWAEEVDLVIGTDVVAQESVVSAFAILAAAASPWEAVCLAASVGGDTDTIGAIVGAIGGSYFGMSTWPADVVQRIRQVNALDVDPVVIDLLRLRSRVD